MAVRYKYKRDKKCRVLTWIECFCTVGIFAVVYLTGHGGYLQAWIIALLIAVLLLFILSIPRYVKVTEDNLEIHCVVEMTRVKLRDVVSIRRVGRSETRFLVPLIGSYGFFGYYGYYFDFRRWETIKVYATEWRNLVEIEDIFEQRYIVSCRQQADLIARVCRMRDQLD